MPAHLLGPDRIMPRVCARHGQRPDFSIRWPIQPTTPMPLWIWLLLPAGFLPFIVALHFAPRKKAVVPEWPFCPRCRARRRALIGISTAVTLVPLLVGPMLAAAVEDETHPAQANIVLGVSCGALLIGLFTAGRLSYLGSPTQLAGAKISDDGHWITFVGPHPEFSVQLSAAVPTAVQAAGRIRPLPQETEVAGESGSRAV